ncbi:Rho GTPase-activating protein 17 [Cichlidogyrus casuarinus]|uniref:Rho GTPase-activating protein 17 n=1 Tax=Cichlidogyrus casuarinus TaxID=1844966 RepID=A0ABD2PV27_9PLAT
MQNFKYFVASSIRKDDYQPPDWPIVADNYEKDVENSKNFFESFIKRTIKLGIYPCNLDEEKILKKTLEFSYAQVIQESNEKVKDSHLLTVLVSKLVSQTFELIAKSRAKYEFQVEKEVLKPFTALSEVQCIDLMKKRKNLVRACYEFHSAEEKRDSTAQSIRQIARNNLEKKIFPPRDEDPKINARVADYIGQEFSQLQQYATSDSLNKLYQALENVEMAENEMLRMRDDTLSDLFEFKATENDNAEILLNNLILHRQFLQDSLSIVDAKIPEVQKLISDRRVKLAYSCELVQHLKENKLSISYVLNFCISFLDDPEALKETRALNIMQAELRLAQSCGNIAVASAMKQYLRELPIPLLSCTTHPDTQSLWSTAAKRFARLLLYRSISRRDSDSSVAHFF